MKADGPAGGYPRRDLSDAGFVDVGAAVTLAAWDGHRYTATPAAE